MANDLNDEDLENRWPQDGDRMFVETEWQSDAYVTSDPAERFYRLPMGYKRAGDILVDRARDDLGDRDNIIYPALFCYRQSVELFLKKIIDEFGNSDARAQLKTHELDVLWERFVQVASERGGVDSIGFGAVASLVRELNDVDERSDAFRFATDRKGAPFALGDRGIDLMALRLAMQGLVNFFECCYLAYENG